MISSVKRSALTIPIDALMGFGSRFVRAAVITFLHLDLRRNRVHNHTGCPWVSLEEML